MNNKKSNMRKRSAALIKAAALTLLTAICIVLALKFSSAESIPVLSQNTSVKSPAVSFEAQAVAVTIHEAEAVPTPAADIEQQPQASPVISSPPELDITTKEVKTGEKKPLLSLDEINAAYKEYGKIITAGMKPEDYDKAMSIEWRVLNTPGDPEDISIDLSDLMDYKDVQNYIFNLDKYEGVEVSVIGQSELGRDIYMVKVDLGDDKESVSNKPIIMMTGNVHAREFAGTEYIIKFLNDALKKSSSDPYTRLLLENATIVAVPLVNPDGRELVIKERRSTRKSNANGVDLNRAMPSANAGQLAAGVKRDNKFSKKPKLAYFAGSNLGTESETQAMIKWFNYYVPIADLYIDLHQQGGTEFYNKRFLTDESDALSKEYAVKNNKLLKHAYRLVSEKKTYGLIGGGGTFTDYAKSVAEGLVYSYSLGRMVLDADGTELPLIAFKDLDLVKQYYKPLNSKFKSICIEIGRYKINRGASKAARKYREIEYNKFGWKNFLTGTIENVLGAEKADSLRQQSLT